MAETMCVEKDDDCVYRITRTDSGEHIVSLRHRSEIGLVLGSSDWHYQHYEAALAGLEMFMVMHAWFRAIRFGQPVGELPKRAEAAVMKHNAICEQLGEKDLLRERQ